MNTHYVALDLRAGLTSSPLERHIDDILEALRGMEGVYDADCVATLARGEVTFTGFVDSDSLDDAAQRFSTAVRAAIHAAQGATPGWTTFDPRGQVRVEAPEPTPA